MAMRADVGESVERLVRRPSRSVTTLHIEGSSVRLLAARGGRVTQWGTEPMEPGLVQEGVVVDPKAVGERIESLLAAQNVGRGGLVAGLSGHRCVPRILDLPQMEFRLLKEAVPREMKKELPVPLDEMHISWQVIGREDGHLRVFALGVPKDVLGPQVNAIRLAGATLRSMDIKPLALVRAVGRSEALIADLEPETLDVIVVRGGIPATIRSVSLRREVERTEDKVHRLGEELARAVKFYRDTHPEEPLQPSTPVYLTGSLAEAAASTDVAEASIGHPMEPLTPALQYTPDLPLATFMVNIGLALKENR
jgi:Tfp pilus assembly PilM family ATPase